MGVDQRAPAWRSARRCICRRRGRRARRPRHLVHQLAMRGAGSAAVARRHGGQQALDAPAHLVAPGALCRRRVTVWARRLGPRGWLEQVIGRPETSKPWMAYSSQGRDEDDARSASMPWATSSPSSRASGCRGRRCQARCQRSAAPRTPLCAGQHLQLGPGLGELVPDGYWADGVRRRDQGGDGHGWLQAVCGGHAQAARCRWFSIGVRLGWRLARPAPAGLQPFADIGQRRHCPLRRRRGGAARPGPSSSTSITRSRHRQARRRARRPRCAAPGRGGWRSRSAAE